MSDDDFQTAYKRAREKVGQAVWPTLSNEQQEAAVAEEMRAIEAERRAWRGRIN